MPKSQDKTKGSRKRKKPSETNVFGNSSDFESKPGGKKPRRRNFIEGIEVSKHVAPEFRQQRPTYKRNTKRKNDEPRLCGNGVPMPSLAELEAMYADSDEDEESAPKITETIKAPSKISTTPEREVPSSPIIGKVNLDSPDALKKITTKVIDKLTKIINLDEDKPRPPVIPQKKPFRSGIPYIVGCKERKQVPWAPKTKFCVGSEEYGVDENQSPDDDECPKEPCTKVNFSKSIFNAKSDEISDWLKGVEAMQATDQANSSPASDRTVDYEYMGTRAFSPLPSTSRDRETILKNDRLFNESLQADAVQPDVEPPDSCDTHKETCVKKEPDVPDDINTVVINDNTTNEVKPKIEAMDVDADDCCIIVNDADFKKKSPIRADSPFNDDIYASIDLTQPYCDNIVYEIDDDDIDKLIAENQAILGRDNKKNNLDNVVSVDSNVIVVDSQNSACEEIIPPINKPVAIVPPVVCHPPGFVECVEVDRHLTSPTTKATLANRGEEIAEVVDNFFREKNNRATETTGTDTVDLTSATSSLRSTMNSITSWIYSIQSFLNRQNPRPSDDVVLVDDNNSNFLHRPSNAMNNIVSVVGITNNHQQSPRKGRKTPKKKTETSTQPSVQPSMIQKEPSPPSPPKRNLGDCPICMDSLANNAVASTICGHVFCMACIKAAIRANGKKCPTCRKALKGVGYHQLFL